MDKVLVVEDDEIIAQSIVAHLNASGFEAIWSARGDIGIARLRFEPTAACVLDLMLPGVDGWQLIETARREGIGTPILVISARGTEQDKIRALDLGADDYLVKPFSMHELAARVRAAARRGPRSQEELHGEAVTIEELVIDPWHVQAYVDGASVELSPTEFRLLYALALERGRVVTRDELMQRIWGRPARHRDRTVDVFVRRIREKIDRHRPGHDFIQTRRGVGYKLDPVPRPRQSLASAGPDSGMNGSNSRAESSAGQSRG